VINNKARNPVINMIATLKSRVEDSRARQKTLEDRLAKTRLLALKWKKKCTLQKENKIDFAFGMMEGQETTLDFLNALQNCLNRALIPMKDGRLALLIDDEQLLSEFTQIINKSIEAMAENIEILASEFPTVPDIAVGPDVSVLSVCKPLPLR
jgi:hypothetical protein